MAVTVDDEKNAAGTETVNVKPLTITTGAQNFVITPADATHEFYAALPALSKQTVSFLATGPYGHTFLAGFAEVTFTAGKYYQSTIKMTEHNTIDLSSVSSDVTAQDGDVLMGTLSGRRKISIADGATVTLNGVTIEGYDSPSLGWAGLTCEGDATIILADGTTNTVKGFYERFPGIKVDYGSTLTIKGNGTLYASSNGQGAGIGGGWFFDCGNIEILGGAINATGGTGAAGIGGGHNAQCGTISISGGSVTATGGEGSEANTGAAGIGSGSGTDTNNKAQCGNISITRGSVTATGGTGAAGIGGGTYATCGVIYIAHTMGSVKITKGSGANYSIGEGNGGSHTGLVMVFGKEGTISTSPYIHVPGFSVNGSGPQVSFSPGNLQATYDGSSWTWHFAAHQWDYIGNAPGNTTVRAEDPYISGTGTVDLFGWSTGNSYFGINNRYIDDDEPYMGNFVDWGNQVISGDPANTWRTLSLDEWNYLLYSRTGASQKYATATVNNVHGLVLLPDYWTLPAGCSFIAGISSWGRNVYNATQWASMEAHGAVFLPAAGIRVGTNIEKDCNQYWTSTPHDANYQARFVLFVEYRMRTDLFRGRDLGCSVRLVR